MKTKRSPVIAAVVVLISVMLACAESTGTYTSQTAGQPPAVTSTALRGTVEAEQVDQYMQAVRAQSTLDAAHAMQTATAIAGQEAAAAAAARATETAWAATVEAEQARAAAAVEAERVRAAAAAAAARITATAEARRDAEEMRVAQATATIEAIMFQQQATATAGAWAVQATATVEAARAIAVAQAAEAEIARLAAERERIVYPVKAYGPWVLLATAMALLVWGMVKLVSVYAMRMRAVARDARGDAPIWAFDQHGEITIYDPDRSLGPATRISPDEITQPMLTDANRQERVTARDQTIDVASRGLPGQRPPARERTTQRMLQQTPQQAPQVRIVDAGEVRPWLADVKPQVLGALTKVESEGR